jgi:hypothetical protein
MVVRLGLKTDEVGSWGRRRGWRCHGGKMEAQDFAASTLNSMGDSCSSHKEEFLALFPVHRLLYFTLVGFVFLSVINSEQFLHSILSQSFSKMSPH